MLQILKQILLIDKDNRNKYKMQFLNDDFIYYEKKVIQTDLPYVKK